MLSSQPLAFSIVGGLPAHPKVALAVLSELSGRQLADFDRIDADGGPHVLDGLQADGALPRAGHRNRRGFDIAAAVPAADGRRMWGATRSARAVAELSPVAADPHDATVETPIAYYRDMAGEHPDWR